MQRFPIFLFWSALCFALVMASLPQSPPLPGDPNDKVLHIVAFVTLALLAAIAYPRLSLLTIFLALALFGGVIEAIQLIPGINRNASLADWLADALAVATTLLVMASMRRLIGPAQSGATIK